MLDINIPGYMPLQLDHLVLDYNGTLAYDGVLIEGVKPRLVELSKQLQIHVLTADTFGNVEAGLAGIPCQLSILPPKNQDMGKLKYVEQLDPTRTVCVGNGRNDRLMLKGAILGVVILQAEGAATETILAADVVAPNILAALDLLLKPLRLKATLRS